MGSACPETLYPRAVFLYAVIRLTQQPRPASGVRGQPMGVKQRTGVRGAQWLKAAKATLQIQPFRMRTGLPVGQGCANGLIELIKMAHEVFLWQVNAARLGACWFHKKSHRSMFLWCHEER
jgi:hypothetical protein